MLCTLVLSLPIPVYGSPALPVDVYSIHSSEKKKAYPFCRICSIYMLCTWHHKITSIFHTFGVKNSTLGDRDVIGTHNNYDIASTKL